MEGVFGVLGIEVMNRLHRGLVWELRNPDDLRESLPGLGARPRVTLDRTWAADRSDIHMLDMNSPLTGLLIKHAKTPAFGGKAAAITGLSGEALFTGILRWQSNHGIRMRQDFLVLELHADGRAELNPERVSRWLLQESQPGRSDLSPQAAKQFYAQAESVGEKRLARLANNDLHPENRQWVCAAHVSLGR